MKKKVGIITFQGSVNFGAQLQAYALQKTITSFNYDCEVLSFSFNSNIKESNDNYDMFVTGSDQVWNPDRTKKTTAYLLGFTNKKKISYAASFGVGEIKEELYPVYKENLLKFNYVSVRENTGANLYKRITGKTAQVVLDPTLLLNKEQWSQYLNISNKKDDYVLIYMLEYSKELVETAKKFAKEHKLNYKIISGTPRIFYYKGVQWNMSPIKFIELFYNAKYVFTNSFHGTVFAINFEKQLFVKLLEKNTKVNNRITDILKMLNLDGRIINKEKNINKFNDIDYTNVSKLLNNEREKSKNFLKMALEGDN